MGAHLLEKTSGLLLCGLPDRGFGTKRRDDEPISERELAQLAHLALLVGNPSKQDLRTTGVAAHRGDRRIPPRYERLDKSLMRFGRLMEELCQVIQLSIVAQQEPVTGSHRSVDQREYAGSYRFHDRVSRFAVTAGRLVNRCLAEVHPAQVVELG